MNTENKELDSKTDRLEVSLIRILEESSITQQLYKSYLAMGNMGSFEEFANDCWKCYRRK